MLGIFSLSLRICHIGTKMTDPRAGKTYQLTWEQWEEYCAEHGIDPREQCEDGEDLGGGDSFTVACYDKPPKEEADGRNENL